MFVVTIDQQDSRHQEDRVPAALAGLNAAVTTRLPFERTVGDELQAVLTRGADVVAGTRYLAREGGWHLGIGIGQVDEPLPGSTRSARGNAFIAAREAVETLKPRAPSLRVQGADGVDPEAVEDADAVLRLLAALWARRSEAGWQAVTAVETARAQDETVALGEVAASLGISHQALSQRLRTAAWELEREAAVTAARLLDRADADGARSGDGEGAPA